MYNVFDPAVTNDLISRIEKLQPATPALWGKMNVAQMLSHAQVGIAMALGDVTIKRTLIGYLVGSFAKKQMVGPKPFSQNLPTHPLFIRKETYDFDTEKGKLILLLQRLTAAGPESLVQEPHPFFGKMSRDEWSILIWKHTDHHLRQFGV